MFAWSKALGEDRAAAPSRLSRFARPAQPTQPFPPAHRLGWAARHLARPDAHVVAVRGACDPCDPYDPCDPSSSDAGDARSTQDIETG
jgi:hypothetical protein